MPPTSDATQESIVQKFLQIASCPYCGTSLTLINGTGSLVCQKEGEHSFPLNKFGFYEFAKKTQKDKYDDEEYAEAYLGDAFGYRFINRSTTDIFVGIGQPEGLYRTIAHLSLSTIITKHYAHDLKVLDVACGVGRCLVDISDCFPNSFLIGLDYSKQMIRVARDAIYSTKPIHVDVSPYGFGIPLFRALNKKNIMLAQADARHLPIRRADEENGFDLVINSMLVDRLLDPDGVEKSLDESVNVLKKNGALIFASPFNWISRETWNKFGSHRSMILEYLVNKHGLIIEEAFDGLVYRENLDPYGGHLELPVLIAKVVKPY